VLRNSPMPPPPQSQLAVTTNVEPRAAAPLRLSPSSKTSVIGVHEAPPSVVRSNPRNGPQMAKLLTAPWAATSVWWVGSVGSNSSAPMDEGMASVSGIHDGSAAVAFVVFQIPPLTLPT